MQARQRLNGGSAVVAARAAETVPDTTEIEGLASAAGYEVVGRITQRRHEDSTYNLGRGKAEALAELVVATDADAVVFDGQLTPGQHGDLSDLLPTGTELVDRYRLVLDIFAEGAGDRTAQLQVELATLQYELPRLRRRTEVTGLAKATERNPVAAAETRIDDLKRSLAEMSESAAKRRAARRRDGFDLVAIAGYTNAGKSTLLHRLADELSVDDLGQSHADLDDTVGVADRLFETLETTTRRGTVDGRRVLFTDTVGLIADLPHDVVRSFSATLGEIGDSDVVLAVIDASASTERVEQRTEIVTRVLSQAEGDEQEGGGERGTSTKDIRSRDVSGRSSTEPTVIPVLNKTDLITDEELAERRTIVGERLASESEPVAVSATEGVGLDALQTALQDALPERTMTFDLPNDGETQSFIAWAHERAVVETTYRGDHVQVSVRGNPETISAIKRRVQTVK